MQAAGTHRLDLGGVGLHGEELHVLASDLFHVVQEAVPNLAVDFGVFHRGIGEYQRGRVEPLFRVGRRVSDHVAVAVAIPHIQGAMWAVLGLGLQPEQTQDGGGEQ